MSRAYAERRPPAPAPRHIVGAWGMTMTAALLGIVLTALVLVIPGLHFAYRSPRGHLVLETFDGSVAAAVTLLLYGRYQRTLSASMLRLTLAFLLFTLTSAYLVILTTTSPSDGAVATVWFPLGARLVAAAIVTLAAVEIGRKVDHDFRARRLLALMAVVFVVLAVAAILAPADFARPMDATVNPSLSSRPLLTGDVVVRIAQAVHALLYAVSALAFTARAARRSDALLRWLGVGCALGAASRVNYLLFPSLYSEWLYTGDLLRTAFYVALFIGAIKELQSYWVSQAEAAVFAERRRLARDLHDGTVQELGYIRVLARGLLRETDGLPGAERIAAAADRALAEARHAIEALSMPLDEPLGDLVRRAACEIGDRYDVDVHVDSSHAGSADRPQREALVRIVREAVSNSARHGEASRVEIKVGEGFVEISDNGHGFDPDQRPNGGFGLISMRDRTDAIRGKLDVTSTPGAGTTVKVVWRATR